jgi:hypothetical protein
VPSYAITLTAEQQLALEFETERRNRLPQPVGPDAPQPPPLTPQDVLQQRVTADLDILGLEPQRMLEPIVQMLTVVEPGARAALIAALEQSSLQGYLRSRRE